MPVNTAGKTFGIKEFTINNHCKDKPWFDRNCKVSRSTFSKLKSDKHMSYFHKAQARDAEKKYKKTIDKAHQQAGITFRKQIDALKKRFKRFS